MFLWPDCEMPYTAKPHFHWLHCIRSAALDPLKKKKKKKFYRLHSHPHKTTILFFSSSLDQFPGQKKKNSSIKSECNLWQWGRRLARTKIIIRLIEKILREKAPWTMAGFSAPGQWMSSVSSTALNYINLDKGPSKHANFICWRQGSLTACYLQHWSRPSLCCPS